MKTIDIYTYPTGEDPYYKARHKVAVMEAFNNGASVEVSFNGNYWEPTDSPLWHDSCKYRIAKAESPIAGGHNPDGLTDEIVGDGYRLLTKEEIEFNRYHAIRDTDTQYCRGKVEWIDNTFNYFDIRGIYRTSKPEGYYLKATFTHWMTILLPEPYRGLAMSNVPDDIKDERFRREYVLTDSFHWGATDEGYTFWYKVARFINDDEDSLPEIPKVKDRYIPWTQENVPIGNVLIKSDASADIAMIIRWYNDCVLIGSVFVKYEELIGMFYSIDNGKSWSPCGVKV